MNAVSSPTVEQAPAVERTLARDMVRRGLPPAPLVILAFGLIWGPNGASSAALAIAVVLVNLLLAAAALGWAAERGAVALMGTALAGFAVRMGLVVAIVTLVQDEPWVDLPALAVSILVTHLGLLFWEMRYVSASLAFPALAPSAKEAHR